MAAKAGDKPTTPQISFPLDDPRWVPMADVVTRLCPRLGGVGPTEYDLDTALRKGRLHCLDRYWTTDGAWERRLVPALCWIGHRLAVDGHGRVAMRRRYTGWREVSKSCPWDPLSRYNPHHHRDGPILRLSGFGQGASILFAWQPDLEQIWPTVFPPAAEPEVRSIATKEWVIAEAERLKRLDKIPDGIGKTAFAKQLANNLAAEARTNRSISVRVVGWKYLRNYLQAWGLWPISAIQ
jgi:hypothetical protein